MEKTISAIRIVCIGAYVQAYVDVYNVDVCL